MGAPFELKHFRILLETKIHKYNLIDFHSIYLFNVTNISKIIKSSLK